MQFPRVWTAMITPFDDNLQVNYDKAQELAAYLAENGTQGIIVSGTTGESPVLSMEEQLQLFAAVKEKVGHKIPVWGGTGSNDTLHAAELSEQAEKVGVDGLLLVVPYYNKPSQEGLYEHFKTIAGRVNIPVMLYNIPGRTSVNMLPATVKRLAAIDNIVAIKEATGDMDQMSALRSQLPEDFLIMSGDDSMTLPMMALGAHGVVSVASHLIGKQIGAMIDAYVAGQVAEAARIHYELLPVFKGLFITSNPVPLKAALNLMGMEVGGLRLPLVGVDKEQTAFVKELLEKFDLI